MQDWTTPSDLTMTTVEMWGIAEATYNSSNAGTGTGGAGGYAKSTINILPSERGVISGKLLSLKVLILPRFWVTRWFSITI